MILGIKNLLKFDSEYRSASRALVVLDIYIYTLKLKEHGSKLSVITPGEREWKAQSTGQGRIKEIEEMRKRPSRPTRDGVDMIYISPRQLQCLKALLF